MTDLADEVTTFCNQVITEVTELRFRPSTVGPHSAPAQVLEEEWEVRGRLDRVEELFLQVLRLKEQLSRALTAAKAEYKDAWNEECVRLNRSAKALMGDYHNAGERVAEMDLNVLDVKIKERQAEKVYSIARETFDYVKIVHEGLIREKMGLGSSIRVFQIESSIGGRR